jgi:hypothetical protein
MTGACAFRSGARSWEFARDLLWMNRRVHADDLDGWRDKPGNRKRIRHLKRALDEFGGRVDVVIVSGKPGVSYGTAQPWLADGSRGATHWEVGDFDENSGHFEAKLVPDTPQKE